mgnify:CR=1 FL=1
MFLAVLVGVGDASAYGGIIQICRNHNGLFGCKFVYTPQSVTDLQHFGFVHFQKGEIFDCGIGGEDEVIVCIVFGKAHLIIESVVCIVNGYRGVFFGSNFFGSTARFLGRSFYESAACFVNCCITPCKEENAEKKNQKSFCIFF